VSPGQELVSLTPLADVWVTAYFNERQLDHVLIGDPVSLKFDAFPGVRLAAHVQSVGPQTAQQFSAVPPENVTGNYTKVIQRVPVKISIDPATDTLRGSLRPGLSVLARIDTTPAAAGPGVRTER
jgi:membrane fusion protein (multidrug efflux system)